MQLKWQMKGMRNMMWYKYKTEDSFCPRGEEKKTTLLFAKIKMAKDRKRPLVETDHWKEKKKEYKT